MTNYIKRKTQQELRNILITLGFDSKSMPLEMILSESKIEEISNMSPKDLADVINECI